jgi:hypothetical protein
MIGGISLAVSVKGLIGGGVDPCGPNSVNGIEDVDEVLVNAEETIGVGVGKASKSTKGESGGKFHFNN